MRKSSFLTFVFAFMPGAAHMYLGLMKKGVSIMTAFLGAICVIALLRMEVLAFILPIIWFYSFFDAINYNGLPYEQKVLVKDEFILDISSFSDKYIKGSTGKKNTLLGGFLLVFGAYLIFDRFIEPVLWQFRDDLPLLNSFIESLPTLFIAFAIIILGLRLIKPKTTDIEDLRDDYKAFGENTNDRE